jgi:O-methyltransferase domain/Dimerisation domain
VEEGLRRAWQLVQGFMLSRAMAVAAKLRLFDLLADGPRTSDELAAATDTHADTLYRLLRALAAGGVLRELDGRRFELTDVGTYLRSDLPGTLHGWAQLMELPSYWNAWSELLHSVRTGENAFRHLHGMDIWAYRADRRDEQAIFDNAMTSNTAIVEPAVLDAYDFGRFAHVVDVAGGRGRLLASILERYPHVRGTLFDQPGVVAHADEQLARFGDRADVVGGSFFEHVPEGADVYLLKSIIHDWEDEQSIAILRTIRAAMAEDAAVLLIERDLGGPNENLAAKLGDLNMLVNPGGRERTEDEYAALFAASGLSYAGATPSAVGFSVYEGRVSNEANRGTS